jgi:hypothetical protein
MKWIEALKVFNQGKGTWCVARKGTPEYDEVKRIMNSSKPEAVAKRNEERGEKVKEQLKEVASASEKRREEAKKKYAEKLAELSTQRRSMRVGLLSEIEDYDDYELQGKVEKLDTHFKQNIVVSVYERRKGTTEWKLYLDRHGYSRRSENHGRSLYHSHRFMNAFNDMDRKERLAGSLFFVEDKYAWENYQRTQKATKQLRDVEQKAKESREKAVEDKIDQPKEIAKIELFTKGLSSLASIKPGTVLVKTSEGRKVSDLFYVVEYKRKEQVHAIQCILAPNPMEVPSGFKGKFSVSKNNMGFSFDLTLNGNTLTGNGVKYPIDKEPIRQSNVSFGKMVQPKYIN